MREFDRDLIRGGHYGQRSHEPRQKAGHMAAPTNAAKREESSCQPGAVHTWHETDMPKHLGDVRYWVNSGKHLLSLSFSGFDPNATSTRRGPSHPAYDGHFDLAPPPIPAGSGCVISSRIGMGISVAGPGAANASHNR
jgi:hypothetical protein